MKAINSLKLFISRSISSPRNRRYKSMIETKKGQTKFLSLLYHDFEKNIIRDSIVSKFSTQTWELPAFTFSEHSGFGVEESTILSAFQNVDYDGWLIISKDGKYGIHYPESPADEIYLKAIGSVQ